MSYGNSVLPDLSNPTSRLAFFVREDSGIHTTNGIAADVPIWSNTGAALSSSRRLEPYPEIHIDYFTGTVHCA